MGLDVYLHDNAVKYEDIEEYEDGSSWSETRYRETQDSKSFPHPDHICTRRYLRSSYNGGGFNSVAGNLISKDLYWIFEPCMETDADYILRPTRDQLLEAQKRAEIVRTELMAVEPVNVAAFSNNTFKSWPEVDAEAALGIYRDRKEKRESGKGSVFDDFSDADGSFYFDAPVKARAFIPGVEFGRKCMWVVYETDLTFYLEMADIIVEFVEEALQMDEPYIRWSG